MEEINSIYKVSGFVLEKDPLNEKLEQKLPAIFDNNLTTTNNSKSFKLKNVYKVLFLVKSYYIYAINQISN